MYILEGDPQGTRLYHREPSTENILPPRCELLHSIRYTRREDMHGSRDREVHRLLEATAGGLFDVRECARERKIERRDTEEQKYRIAFEWQPHG